MSAAEPLPRPPEPTGRILNITDAAYYADPCEQPSLSQSIAKTLVTESPLHAWYEHPKLGGGKRTATPAMTDGILIHKMLLGKGGESIQVVDCEEYRSNADKAIRDAVLAAGKTPVKRKDYAKLEEAAATMRDRLAIEGYHLTGESEVKIAATEHMTEGAPVNVRGQLDHVWIDEGIIFDVKSADDVNPKSVTKRALDLGLDIQQIVYTRLLEAIRPELIGRIKFLFLFVESKPPYCVVPYELRGKYRKIGALRWERALAKWQECLATSRWPGYYDRKREGGHPIGLEPPPWVLKEQLNESFGEYDDED